MLLTHDPFVVTPDSEQWGVVEDRYKQDTALFADMVNYTDQIVGRFVKKLEEHNIRDNTILIFTADNGTHVRIYSDTRTGQVKGAKGNTIDHGTHVPLIVNWPAQINTPKQHDGLVGFADFYATIADVVGSKDAAHDGMSLLPILKGEDERGRVKLFVHYDPRWSDNVNAHRNQFARTTRYKLYQDGRFFDLDQDIMEEESLTDLSTGEKAVRTKLKALLDQAPALSNSD